MGAFWKSLQIGRTVREPMNNFQNCCVALLCQKHAVTRFLGWGKIFGAFFEIWGSQPAGFVKESLTKWDPKNTFFCDTKNASENEAQNCCVAILCQKHAVTRFLGSAKIFGAPRGRVFEIWGAIVYSAFLRYGI